MSHTEAVHHIVRFLIGTRNEGIILQPQEVSFECFADADFCGLWNKDTAEEDSNTAKSRMGYMLTYAKCPLVWASKLAGPFYLSTTEAEYVTTSEALREPKCFYHVVGAIFMTEILSSDFIQANKKSHDFTLRIRISRCSNQAMAKILIINFSNKSEIFL